MIYTLTILLFDELTFDLLKWSELYRVIRIFTALDAIPELLAWLWEQVLVMNDILETILGVGVLPLGLSHLCL